MLCVLSLRCTFKILSPEIEKCVQRIVQTPCLIPPVRGPTLDSLSCHCCPFRGRIVVLCWVSLRLGCHGYVVFLVAAIAIVTYYYFYYYYYYQLLLRLLLLRLRRPTR